MAAGAAGAAVAAAVGGGKGVQRVLTFDACGPSVDFQGHTDAQRERRVAKLLDFLVMPRVRAMARVTLKDFPWDDAEMALVVHILRWAGFASVRFTDPSLVLETPPGQWPWPHVPRDGSEVEAGSDLLACHGTDGQGGGIALPPYAYERSHPVHDQHVPHDIPMRDHFHCVPPDVADRIVRNVCLAVVPFHHTYDAGDLGLAWRTGIRHPVPLTPGDDALGGMAAHPERYLVSVREEGTQYVMCVPDTCNTGTLYIVNRAGNVWARHDIRKTLALTGTALLVQASLARFLVYDALVVKDHRREEFTTFPSFMEAASAVVGAMRQDWPDHGLCVQKHTPLPTAVGLGGRFVEMGRVAAFTVDAPPPADGIVITARALPRDGSTEGGLFVCDLPSPMWGEVCDAVSRAKQ